MNIRKAGEELFGQHWQPRLAELIEINLRTVQRWAAGQNPVPPDTAGDIIDILNAVRRIRARAAADRARRNEG